jgi:hypothetical protein
MVGAYKGLYVVEKQGVIGFYFGAMTTGELLEDIQRR